MNRSARIMGAANGSQVLVSDLTTALVEQVSDVKLVDLGSIELKGGDRTTAVFGVAGDGHEWLDVPLLTGQVTRGNLPRLQKESVGDLAYVQRRVANLARASVVTLTGSGGVGKTRAAIEIGRLVVDGVWLVELAPVADPDLAVTTIASTLGAPLQPSKTMVESIVDWCLGRRMLLIVDNCEHPLGRCRIRAERGRRRGDRSDLSAPRRDPIGDRVGRCPDPVAEPCRAVGASR